MFSGAAEQLPQFKEAGLLVAGEDAVPFPILLDQDLRAVEQLGIQAPLAKPSTFVVNKQAKVVLSHFGNSSQQRPSNKALLEVLEALQAQSASSGSASPL